MRCPRCNHWVKSDDLYCPKCGLKVTRPTKIQRSKSMKRMMYVIFASLGVFMVGALLAIIAPLVGLVLVIVGGICLVISSCAYLVLEYKHLKVLNTSGYGNVSPLPQEPVHLRPSSGFVYPDMLRVLPDEYMKMISAGWENFLVEVIYSDSMVMQFINVPEVGNGEFENIGIFFYPYQFEDEALTKRFVDNYYMWCFDNKIYSDEGTAAYFGNDLNRAMKVASYILATVYYIPLDAQLTIQVDTR